MSIQLTSRRDLSWNRAAIYSRVSPHAECLVLFSDKSPINSADRSDRFAGDYNLVLDTRMLRASRCVKRVLDR